MPRSVVSQVHECFVRKQLKREPRSSSPLCLLQCNHLEPTRAYVKYLWSQRKPHLSGSRHHSCALSPVRLSQNIEVVTDDGAPSGRKDFIIWCPPPNDPMDPTLGRHSSLLEATALMRRLMQKGVRTIMFTKARFSFRCHSGGPLIASIV